jgi:hypothetical protein
MVTCLIDLTLVFCIGLLQAAILTQGRVKGFGSLVVSRHGIRGFLSRPLGFLLDRFQLILQPADTL